jgi:tetratricopeptide (TPR) repeat protein
MLPFLGYGILSYRDGWRIASIVITLYILVMIVLVKTRSVWIGLALAMVVLAVIVSLYSTKLEFPRWFRNFVIGSLAAGAVTVAVIYSLPKPDNPYSILGRIRYLGDMSVGENRHRVSIWTTTVQLIKDHPITGVGAGNWRLHAAYYFDGRFEEVPQLNWARPHNDYLWVWAEKGIVGIVLFLLLFGLLIYYQLAIIRKSPHTGDKILASFLMATVVVYLTISLFSFPYERLNHQMYLALIIGATATMYARFHTFKPFRPQVVAILIPILAFSVFGMAMGYRTTKQEVLLNKSISAMHHEDWRVMLSNARAAQDNPFRSLDPLSNPPEYYEGMALAKLGRHAEAVAAYEKAKAQFPNNMWIINWLGQSYYHVGRYDEAIVCLDKVLKILPDFREAYINLSATYYAMGDLKNSHEALTRIPGWEDDDAVVRNMRVLENMMRRQAEEN